MWDLKTIIKDYLRTKSFQEFINNRFNDNNRAVLSIDVFKTISTESEIFYMDKMVETVEQVVKDYKYDDLRKTDIVLDIGACIGAFSLKIHNNVNHVYSVEPMLTDKIIKNIHLNNAQNITVFNSALGNGILNLRYNNYTKNVLGISLTKLLQMCGENVDFLKCDCEGGEWCITPEELKNIRRIEMEVHNLDGKHDFKDYLNMLKIAGFVCTNTIYNDTVMIIHASRY